MLHLVGRVTTLEEKTPHVEELFVRVENVSRQLGRWIESLKDSPYKGGRFHNAQTRQAAEAAQRRDQFLAKIREIQDEAMRGRNPSAEGGSGTE
jgi:hypothetical protein